MEYEKKRSTSNPNPNLSFHDIMQTPTKAKKKIVGGKKSINYIAIVISKSLFDTETKTTIVGKGKGTGKETGRGKGNV